jgi:hypothetical protein
MAESVGQNGPQGRPVRSSLMGQNGAQPCWPRGRMSFPLWTMDCRGIRGERNRVVTTRPCSSQAVFGPKNNGFPALRPNRLPTNSAEEAKKRKPWHNRANRLGGGCVSKLVPSFSSFFAGVTLEPLVIPTSRKGISRANEAAEGCSPRPPHFYHSHHHLKRNAS